MPSEPINILYLSSFGNLRWGGQKSLYYLVSRLDRTFFQPHVVLPTDEDFARQLRKIDIPVVILDLPGLSVLRWHEGLTALAKLFGMMGRNRIHLIHTDAPRNTFYAGLAAKARGIPLVWHIRVSERDRYDRMLYHFPARIILAAKSIRGRFDRGYRDTKFVVIHNGIDPAEFEHPARGSSLREKLGIPEDTLLIAAAGRIEHQKGQKVLIEACGKVKDRLNNFRLLLFGEVQDVHYVRTCEEISRELGIGDHIVFAGYEENLIPVLHDIDIFVSPSFSEAFPRSVLEAMAAGKPVIVTDVGGSAEAVDHALTGFVVPPGDPEAMAGRIVELCQPDKRLDMGLAARKKVQLSFSIERHVEETERLYRNLLKGRPFGIRST